MKRWNKAATPLLVGEVYATNQIAVWCPYCKKHHIHGWNPKEHKSGDAEHRVAHCFEDSPFHATGYFIAAIPQLKCGIAQVKDHV